MSTRSTASIPSQERADCLTSFELQPMQAVALHDAISTLVDVVDGLMCQPRFSAGGLLNPAGQALDDLRARLNEIGEAAMDVAAHSEPTGHYDRLGWAEARLRHAARGCESIEDIVAFAQSLARPKS